MDVLLTDRTYLVTGGGSGIGKGVAEGIAAARTTHRWSVRCLDKTLYAVSSTRT